MGVLLGQPERRLISSIYATYFLPDADVRLSNLLAKDPVENQSVLAILAEQNGELALTYPRDTLRKLDSFPGHLDDLLGELVSADLFADDAHPCNEIAFALRDALEVRVYSVCEYDSAHRL